MPRKKQPAPYPQPVQYVAGVGVFLFALSIYAPSAPWTSVRIGLTRDLQRLVSLVAPPTGITAALDVPFHKQEHALSCEIASLRSALLAIGVDVPESILLDALPFDATRKQMEGKEIGTWGDPDKGFVGDINGRMPTTGYGVHAPALATVAELYAVPLRIRADDAAALVRAIDARHPVIVWSTLGTAPRSMTWKTPEGKQVRAAAYEHTLVVTGYRGSAERIEAIEVVDPQTGLREESWETFTWRTGFLDHQALEIAPANF